MTKIQIMQSEYVSHVVIDGHQDGAGENIYCAAISALGCTLAEAVRKEKLSARPTIHRGDGRLVISYLRTPRTDAFTDMFREGCEAMAGKYPERYALE